jgi:hypothetical protein
MGVVLGLGTTQCSPLLSADNQMSLWLRLTQGDPDIPANKKDPMNWSPIARDEWAEDQGLGGRAANRDVWPFVRKPVVDEITAETRRSRATRGPIKSQTDH